MRPEPARPPYLAVGLLSAAALGYEILLTRLFALIQWHHFAAMIISVAMLGWGAAGTLVALRREGLLAHFHLAFGTAAAMFAVTSIGCFLLAQAIRFNPLEAFWDGGQFLRLAAIYLCLLVPFLAAATALCLAFSRFGSESPRLYSADIMGAGAGSLGLIGVLFLLSPLPALGLVAAVALLAAALALVGRGRAAPLALFAAALFAAVLPGRLALHPSEYKDLSQALAVVGARVLVEESGPLGVLTVVDNRQVPLRYAPGLSLAFEGRLPAQLALYSNGDGPAPIVRYTGRREELAYLDALTSALPYHLLTRPRVLVLAAGTGQDVLQALFHGAASVDAVEANDRLLALLQQRFAAFSGRPYSRPGVQAHLAEARAFVAGSPEQYDLIQLTLVDAPGAAGALAENHLYTVEAFTHYLDRLRPDGLLAITRWIDLPPRDLLKLAATASTALTNAGVREPGLQLALIRSWKTGTLLVKNGAFTTADTTRIRTFCDRLSFDADWYPGIRPEETNHYNVLDHSYYHEAMAALLGPKREGFLAGYPYRLEPASDDRPYFFHFFKWSSLPEWWSLRGRGGASLLEWGYPVLVATLVQATLAGLAFTLLPLWLGRWHLPRTGIAWVVAYFTALGLGFMFLEIAFIQKFMLYLGHPLYAVAVVLCGFLLFAGLGSRLSERLAGEGRMMPPAALAIAGLALLYLWLLPLLFRTLSDLADAARILVTLALIAPIAFFMGMPFPLGLQRLAATRPALIPWAWAVNAFVSVVAAVLATLLAVHIGLAGVVALAVGCYLGAAWIFPRGR